MRLKTRRKIDTREKRLVSLHHSAILYFIRPANVNSLKPICLYDFNGILLTKNHNHAGTTFPLTYALFETIFCHFFFSKFTLHTSKPQTSLDGNVWASWSLQRSFTFSLLRFIGNRAKYRTSSVNDRDILLQHVQVLAALTLAVVQAHLVQYLPGEI